MINFYLIQHFLQYRVCFGGLEDMLPPLILQNFLP